MYDETETRFQNDQSYNNFGFKFLNGESLEAMSRGESSPVATTYHMGTCDITGLTVRESLSCREPQVQAVYTYVTVLHSKFTQN